ncbi:hypothetical protein A2U01_0116666, partial [Trifolium medium]|nr:hypothetical protein [Trifolium medium]
CHLRVAQGLVARCAMMLSSFVKLQSVARRAGKDGASRQQVLRRLGAFVICASRRRGRRVAPGS